MAASRKAEKPLLPLFDHLVTTLVSDLDQRGLLDEVLVLAMGEFGRTPQMGTQGSTGRPQPLAGRRMPTMLLAGGGFHHGQVIRSATEKTVGNIKRRFTPAIPAR